MMPVRYRTADVGDALVLRYRAIELDEHQPPHYAAIHFALEVRKPIAGEDVLGLGPEIDSRLVLVGASNGLASDHRFEGIRGDRCSSRRRR